MTKEEALDLALKALETCEVAWPGTIFKSKYFAEDEVKAAITAIKQALAIDKMADNARDLGLDYEPVPENFMDALRFDVAMRDAAQRPWVGLTDEERKKLWRDVVKWDDPSHDDVDLMEAIEAKLKEKNHDPM